MIAGSVVTVRRRRGDGLAADGHGAPVGVAGNGGDRIGSAAVHRLAGGCLHIGRYFLTENLPSQFGIIDKNITVALDVLRLVVSAHFPGVDRVHFTPLQEGVQTFNDLQSVVGIVARSNAEGIIVHKEVRLTPAAPDVQQDTGNVAFDVVIDLHAVSRSGIIEDIRTVILIGFVARDHIADIAHGHISAGRVDICIGRAEVMQVRARIGL